MLRARGQMPPTSRVKNGVYAGGLILLVGFFGSAPMLLKARNEGKNLTSQEAPLTGSQIMRGAFMNTGSKDVGPDRDWKNGDYIGPHKGGATFDPSAADIAEARARLEARKRELGLPARSAA